MSAATPTRNRKGSTGVSSQDYNRLYETVQGLVQQASATQSSVAALTEVMKSHDERLARIESGGNVAVLAESVKGLTERVGKVEGAPAKWLTWLAVAVSIFTALLMFLGMVGGGLVFLITHLGG
jgi:DNA-binding PucR family transcriptional regulator